MLKKQTILKFAMIISIAILLAITSSACIAPNVENTYEKIIKDDNITATTQESTVPEALSATRTKPPVSAEKLKDNYMRDVLQKIEEKKKVNKEKDILFIGNSLTEGMRATTDSYNKFICEIGVSLDGLDLSDMRNMDFKVVVINMGTNELGHYDEEHFKQSYKNLIEKIYEVNKDARIICCSVPPIAEETQYSEHYNNENAKLYSRYIKELCQVHNLEYLDNKEFFGETLNQDLTSDGLHFHGDIYARWYEFILEKISPDVEY